MSSQHLEEADELADRICIMTKGQLLALDTPFEIKKQFGLGYKILIEPKTDIITTDDFLNLKQKLIDNIILSKENKAKGVSESSDSTQKKLIYHVPFSEVSLLGNLMNKLEKSILNQTYLDVEMNSLEDAYLNIAKEEEKLLWNLKNPDQVRKPSQIDDLEIQEENQIGNFK